MNGYEDISEIIYLQWYGDDEHDKKADEVTWCDDKINDNDLEYKLVKKSKVWYNK
jgi:hypothetical protein